MQHKLTFKILIFFLFTILVVSCGQNKKTTTPPIAVDSASTLQAAKEISKAIEANPEDAELLYQRAQIYQNGKFLNRAEGDLVEAIRIDSLNPLYHFSLARTYYAMNQTQNAAKQYEYAIALKPDYQDAMLKLADLYFVVKEHNKSIGLLNKCMKLDQGNANIYHMLGMNYKEMGDTSRAIYHFQTAIENDPKDFESNLYIANLYAVKKNKMAMEYFNAAIKLKPKNVDAWFGRAVFEQNLRLYKNALFDYRKVIDLDPMNYLSYYNVGYINYENGMQEEALKNWNICTQMNPNYGNAFYMKGLVFEEQKNKSDAKINYKIALEIEPENPLFQTAIKRIN
jgi:tetratricopeptide (TPR) repeat protein